VYTVAGTDCGDEPTTVFETGQTFTYCYTVENTGNVALSNVVLEDNDGNQLVDGNGSPVVLCSGPSCVLEVKGTATASYSDSICNAGTNSEVVTASGVPSIGGPVTDDGDATIYIMEKCEFSIGDAFSGIPMDMSFSITNIYDDPTDITGVQIIVEIADTDTTGDIRGIFLNFDQRVSCNDVTAKDDSGTNRKGQCSDSYGNVITVNNDVTMQGGGKIKHAFDLGFEIGTLGLAKDDIKKVIITIAGITTDDFDGEVGVRLTSVGTPGGKRLESSKTYGTFSCPCGTE